MQIKLRHEGHMIMGQHLEAYLKDGIGADFKYQKILVENTKTNMI